MLILLSSCSLMWMDRLPAVDNDDISMTLFVAVVDRDIRRSILILQMECSDDLPFDMTIGFNMVYCGFILYLEVSRIFFGKIC